MPTVNFTSCFLAIPLPTQFQVEFEGLLAELKKIGPSFTTVRPQTPHVTVCYFGNIPDEVTVRTIFDRSSKHADIVRGINLSIGGLGTFGGNQPRTLFLAVKYPAELVELNQKLRIEFADFPSVDNEQEFYPHLTIARLRKPAAQLELTQHRAQIAALADQINWTFDVNELVIYGVDSRQQPELQQKLLSIKV